MSTHKALARTLCGAGAILPLPVFAHHLMDGEAPNTLLQGLLSGLAHPVIGPDHFVFLLLAGLLSGLLVTRMRFIAPAVFVLGALLGTVLRVSGADVPGSEILIALSVLAGGALVLRQRGLDAVSINAFFSVAGLFHGYAYAASVIGVETSPLSAYLAGLALTQYAVILAAMTAARRLDNPHVMRVAGSAALVVGAVLLTFSLI